MNISGTYSKVIIGDDIGKYNSMGRHVKNWSCIEIEDELIFDVSQNDYLQIGFRNNRRSCSIKVKEEMKTDIVQSLITIMESDSFYGLDIEDIGDLLCNTKHGQYYVFCGKTNELTSIQEEIFKVSNFKDWDKAILYIIGDISVVDVSELANYVYTVCFEENSELIMNGVYDQSIQNEFNVYLLLAK